MLHHRCYLDGWSLLMVILLTLNKSSLMVILQLSCLKNDNDNNCNNSSNNNNSNSDSNSNNNSSSNCSDIDNNNKQK